MGWKHRNSKRKRHFAFNRRRNAKRPDTIIPDVEITQEALETLRTYRQIEGAERPGVMVGSVIGENKYRINRISPPLVKGNASHTGCERDGEAANAYVLSQYELSEHTRIYLGEWHTHPEDEPIPSGRDISSIMEISCLPDMCLPFVILCIIGRTGNYWGAIVNNELHDLKVHILPY